MYARVSLVNTTLNVCKYICTFLADFQYLHISSVEKSMLPTNFTIKDSKDNVGNILRASKDLNSRDVVLSEAPLIVGPNHRPIPVCLECLSFILSSETENW